MRHDEAEIGSGLDACRSLSRKGREQTAAVVKTWLQRKPPILAAYRSPLTRASQTADELMSQFPEPHFNVADRLLPTANPESVLPQLEKISRLPGFNGPPLPAEQSAGLLLVGHNPVLSVLWTLLQGDSAGHPLIMGTSQLVCLDVFAPCHDGGAFVYTVEP